MTTTQINEMKERKIKLAKEKYEPESNWKNHPRQSQEFEMLKKQYQGKKITDVELEIKKKTMHSGNLGGKSVRKEKSITLSNLNILNSNFLQTFSFF